MSSDAEQLADKRYIIVMLRLLVDQHGRLLQGEALAGAASTPQRFKGWKGLNKAIRAALKSENNQA
jgi:hypothetical protein